MNANTDKRISNTGIKKEIDFQNMIEDAPAWKIDLIVMKPVKSFTTIRKIKVNIETFDGKGDKSGTESIREQFLHTAE